MAGRDYSNSIQEFYRNRSILITGATGFMGKVLVEKLLYSCSDVKQIFVLIRSKRGKSVEARLKEMFMLPMFERIRKEKPQVLKKVTSLKGDLTMDGLGLNEKEKETLITEVSIVFHGGATVRVESSLKDTIEMNVTGTWQLLQICKRMKKLKAFIHSSTAYCYPELEILEERAYDCNHNPEDIMRLARCVDPAGLEEMSKKLIAPHPNAYTFSKRLAERLVIQEFPNLPTCIVRPSIVCPAYRDPLPGWVDNLNGPVGVTAAVGKGVLRSIQCDPNAYVEMVPVDFAINAMIAIGKHTALEKKPAEIPVYNLTQGKVRQKTYGEFLKIGLELVWEYPFEVMLWYPNVKLRTNYWIHRFYSFVFQWIPAYLIDFLLLLFGQQRFMVRIQNRISVGLSFLQHFTTRQWEFQNKNFLQIVKNMSAQDKEIFFIDFMKPEDKEYFGNAFYGGRCYCMKDPPETIPRGKRLMRVLYVLDRLTRFVFYVYVIHLVVSWLNLGVFWRGLWGPIDETRSKTIGMNV